MLGTLPVLMGVAAKALLNDLTVAAVVTAGRKPNKIRTPQPRSRMARSKKKPKRARRSRRVTGLVAASASNAVVLLNFEVKLPSGPNTNNVIIAGGADADRNGNVENNGEYGVFTRAANTFTYSQTVPGPVSGMAFYVQITAGPNVPYELTIKDSSGASRYSGANTTVAETEYIRWSLS